MALLLALAIVAPSVLAQGDKRTDAIATLLKEWAKDGVTVKTDDNPDGSQSLAVLAEGGYLAVKAKAKAGKPAILRVYTNGTYDCSRAFIIPSLGIKKILPAKGVVEFKIPSKNAGTVLRGTCSMGMYRFSITFE
jgi:plastocyanin domain-containing protein